MQQPVGGHPRCGAMHTRPALGLSSRSYLGRSSTLRQKLAPAAAASSARPLGVTAQAQQTKEGQLQLQEQQARPAVAAVASAKGGSGSNGAEAAAGTLNGSDNATPELHNGHSDAATAVAAGGLSHNGAQAVPAGPAEAAEAEAEPYTLVEKHALAGGVLDFVRLEGDRLLRIWLPPCYSRVEAARHPYPVLLLNDGQNLFDDRLSFSGSSWRAGETAAALITSGQLPPFVLVGIDHAGADRSLDYLPYKPGMGPGNFREDAAKWPGGEVEAYMARVVDEILPWLAQSYGTAVDAAHVAFGGSSFGGICALYASMRYPDRFGAVLVESPSLWINDEKFLKEDVEQYEGPWPQRIFLAMGDKEYTGIRKLKGDEGKEWDQLLVDYCEELAALLESKGLDASRLKWQVDKGTTHTEAAWAKRLPEALLFLLQHWWAGIEARHSESLFFTSPRKLRAGQPAVLYVNKAKSHALAGQPGRLQVKLGFNNWTLGEAQLELAPAPQLEQQAQQGPETKWQMVSFTVPPDAYEMQFVLTDATCTHWDNNAGCDFYMRVKLPPTGPAAGQSPEAILAAARAAAQGPVDEIANRSGTKLYFTSPEVPVAGAPMRLYFNRARSWPLAHNPNIKLHYGFNNWELGSHDMQLAPTNLWRGEMVDWWATQPFEVPEQAFDISFAFTDGHGCWDSNDGHNFSTPVLQLKQQKTVPPRTIAHVEAVDHAGGKLHVITLSRREGTDTATKRSRWTEEKTLRVWTPPQWTPGEENAPPGGWPVLWMNDGQNKFEDWLAHQGTAWNVGHCAAGLIAGGIVPPFIVAAVDSAGPMRSLNYLPYKPGTGLGGFRGDAEKWPGGGCEAYMRRLVQELMPLVTQKFSTATDPAKVAFGGGSFAGVTALYAAMHYPHVFGAVLAESPSLWIAEGLFLGDMWKHHGALPERLFMGCGTREYSATRDHDRDDVDALLLYYYQEAYRALENAGMRGGQRLAFQVEEGAGHHELAWQWRLTGALTFLLSPWWDE